MAHFEQFFSDARSPYAEHGLLAILEKNAELHSYTKFLIKDWTKE